MNRSLHQFRSYFNLSANLAILACTLCLTSPIAAKPATEISTDETGITLKINQIPNNRMLSIAKFNNPISRVYFQKDEEETDLKLTAETTHWNILLPKNQDPKEGNVRLETIGRPYLAGQPVVINPETDGSLKLPAHLAIIIGENLRYEPQTQRNTIGHWTNENDYAEWHFQPNKPGKYRVEILQSCEKKQGGSQVALRVGEEELKYKVKDTGHIQNFELRKAGTIELKSTEPQILELKPLNKAHNSIMNVRLINLTPIN